MKKLLVILALMLPLTAQADTWCQGWDPLSAKEKVEFLRSRESMVRESLDKHRPDKKAQNEVAMECYSANIKTLLDDLDHQCRVEKVLTQFFKQQVDTSDQEHDDITAFINHCVELADGGEPT